MLKCNTCGHRVRKGVIYNGNFIHLRCAITLSELYMKMLDERIKLLEELENSKNVITSL